MELKVICPHCKKPNANICNGKKIEFQEQEQKLECRCVYCKEVMLITVIWVPKATARKTGL